MNFVHGKSKPIFIFFFQDASLSKVFQKKNSNSYLSLQIYTQGWISTTTGNASPAPYCLSVSVPRCPESRLKNIMDLSKVGKITVKSPASNDLLLDHLRYLSKLFSSFVKRRYCVCSFSHIMGMGVKYGIFLSGYCLCLHLFWDC